MKKLILLTAFIGLFFTPTFSQINGRFEIDTTIKNRSIFNYQKPFKLSDTIRFNCPFSGSLNNKHLVFPKFSERNFYHGQIPTVNFANAWSYDRMPCLRPEGYFPMKIAKPDSAVRYSLLIKRY
jgi:hypothetical protein